MKFLDNYLFKTAVVVIFLFLSIPLLMPDTSVRSDAEGDEAYSDIMPVNSNPLVKIFDRVSSFYGFGSSPGKKESSGVIDLAAISKKIYGALVQAPEGEQIIMASNNRIPSYLGDSSLGSAQGYGYNSGVSPAAGASMGLMNLGAVASPAKPSVERNAIEYNDRKYDVIESYGRKYAITEKGPQEVDNLLLKGAVYNKQTALSPQAQNGLQQSGVVSRQEYEARRAGSGYKTSGGGSSAKSGGFSNTSARGGSSGVNFNSMSGSYDNAKAKLAAKGSSGGSARVNTKAADASNNYLSKVSSKTAAAPKEPYMGTSGSYYDYYYTNAEPVVVTAPDEDGGAILFEMPGPTIGSTYKASVSVASTSGNMSDFTKGNLGEAVVDSSQGAVADLTAI